MKIALFGGRFDPPHVGHFLIARQVLENRQDIEKVIFVPAYKHTWFPTVASPDDRIKMLSLCLEKGIEVSDVEVKRGGVSFAIDTIREIKQKTKNELFWIIGSDNLQDFNRWKDHEEILKLAKILVYPRGLCTLPEELPVGFEKVEGLNLITSDTSSAVIRQRIKEGKGIKYLVPEEIEKYIKENKLYE
jgi:nicotinate-nucleotide adenylyltransferase